MDQESRDPLPGPSLLEEARRQMVLLLGLVVSAEVIFHRGGAGAAVGLRLYSRNALLRWLSETGEAAGPSLRTALLLAALLYAALETIPRRPPGRGPALPLLALGATICGLWALVWRIGPAPDRAPPQVLALPILVAALIPLAARIRKPGSTGALLATLGAALCTLWFVLVRELAPPPESAALVEKLGEVLLLAGVGLAGFPRLGAPAGTSWKARVAGVAVAAGTALLLAIEPDGAFHVLRHLFHVREAGLPDALIAALSAIALGSITTLLLAGPAGRVRGIALLVLLASARGPAPEFVALRAAAAPLLVRAFAPRPFRRN